VTIEQHCKHKLLFLCVVMDLHSPLCGVMVNTLKPVVPGSNPSGGSFFSGAGNLI